MARRKKLTISIPEYLENDLRNHVYFSHFSSVSEYIRDLVRRDLHNEADKQLARNAIHARQQTVQQTSSDRPMFRWVD